MLAGLVDTMRTGLVSMVTVTPSSSVIVTGNAPSDACDVAEVVVSPEAVVVAVSAGAAVESVVADAVVVVVLPSPPHPAARRPALTSSARASRTASGEKRDTTLPQKRQSWPRRRTAWLRMSGHCGLLSVRHLWSRPARWWRAGWLLPGRTTVVEPSWRPTTQGRSRSLHGKRLLLLRSRYLAPGTRRARHRPEGGPRRERVSGHSGGTAPASHRLPSQPRRTEA